MPKGPHEAQLDTFMSGQDYHDVYHSAKLWSRGSAVLADLAEALDLLSPSIAERIGGQTGEHASKAFTNVAKNVQTESQEMSGASTALTSAGDALRDAHDIQQKNATDPMGTRPADATQKSGESAADYHDRQHTARQSQTSYDTAAGGRETRSKKALDGLQTHYGTAITVMEKIHGDPPTYGGAGGGGTDGPGNTYDPPGAGPTPGFPGTHVVTTPTFQPPHLDPHHVPLHVHVPHHDDPVPQRPHVPLHVKPPLIHDPSYPPTPAHHGTYDGTDPSYPPTPGHHGTHGGTDPADPGSWPVGHPGSPQGPVGVPPGGYPGGLPPTTPTVGSTMPGSTSAGPSSTMVGGLMGGSMIGGAGGLRGVLRGSALTGALSEEEILASRTTGATGASARSGASAASGASARSGASGSAGGRPGARGAATAATGVGRGAGGTGAGGRADRGKKTRKKGDVDFFEDNEDWLDEDEASPGVLH